MEAEGAAGDHLYALFRSACAIQYSYHSPVAALEGEAVQGIVNFVGPSSRLSNHPFVRMRARWAQLLRWWSFPGPVARRMREYSQAALAMLPNTPKLIITQLGVVPEATGRGTGTKLLNHIRELAEREPRAHGVGITTYSEDNVELYVGAGFEVVGQTVVHGINAWALFARMNGRADGLQKSR